VHKVAIPLGALTIYWYGIFLALGVGIGLWTASRRALRDNIPPEKILDIGLWLVIGAIFGSRLFYVIYYWNSYFAQQSWWEIFNVRQGLVFQGGLLGASLAGFFYIRIHRFNFWLYADILAPSIALGHVFGRMGCLMNGCCYGSACSWPWAIHFPDDHETAGVGVHPTQIYESVLNLFLYGFLIWLLPRRRFQGQIFSTYLIGYAILRFCVEFFRGDYLNSLIRFGITPAQWLSLGIICVGFGFHRWRSQSVKHERAD
jgi:phosphatidylglycerol:prolipoprotein diacylglycerol transferase